MVRAVSTMICQVADMNRSNAFYRDVLGLTPGVQSPYWSDFKVGSVLIGLHPPFKGSEPPYGIVGKGWVLGFEVTDVRALRDRVKSAGVHVAEGFHDVPGGAVLEFSDPDGNAIQAIQLGVAAKDLG